MAVWYIGPVLLCFTKKNLATLLHIIQMDIVWPQVKYTGKNKMSFFQLLKNLF
jgi:hypothetical protein